MLLKTLKSNKQRGQCAYPCAQAQFRATMMPYNLAYVFLTTIFVPSTILTHITHTTGRDTDNPFCGVASEKTGTLRVLY